MTKRFCDICGTEMECNYNCLTLGDGSDYGEDRRDIFCNDICYACSTALIDKVGEMKAAHTCAEHEGGQK